MKNKISRKIIAFVICGMTLMSMFPVHASASSTVNSGVKNYDDKKELLLEQGFSMETIDVVGDDDINDLCGAIESGREVQISNTYMEVDNLFEIEQFFSCEETELLNMGFSKDDIETTVQYFDDLLKKTDAEIATMCDVDMTEVKMLRKTFENAERNKAEGNDDKKIFQTK